MKHISWTIMFSLVGLFSCTEEKDCCDLPNDELSQFEGNTEDFLGTWQVYEYGYSPGAGYFTVDVPAEPLKYLELMPEHAFNSNYEGLTDFNYFLVLDNPNDDSPILALFESMPAQEDLVMDELSHSYRIWQAEDGVNLQFRYCIEGCHIGIRKLTQ